MKIKISMTGAGGFLGNHFTLACSEKKILVNAIRNYKKKEQVTNNNVIEKTIDFDREESIANSIESSDFLIHAACIPKNIATNNEKLSMKYGPQYTEKICRACVESNVPLIYISSAQVYQPTSKKVGIKETSNKFSNSIYAMHKLLSEEIIVSFSKQYKLDFVILRPFNIIGKNLYDRNRMTIENIFISKVLKKEKIEFFTNPRNCMDFINIKSMIDIIFLTMHNFQSTNGQILNAGSGIPTSLYQLASYIYKYKDRRLLEATTSKDLPEEHLLADTKKMKAFLGIQPKNNLQESLNTLYDELIIGL